jgi:hypothetical protein
MRWMACLVLLLTQLSLPLKADFLLNCRLMTPEIKEVYRRHCKWETVVKCKPGEACIIKRQNFVSGYGNSALSTHPGWLGAVSLTNPVSGIGTVAGVGRPLDFEGAGSELLATSSDAVSELSGALGSTAQSATKTVH